jgi:hypothetical protein
MHGRHALRRGPPETHPAHGTGWDPVISEVERALKMSGAPLVLPAGDAASCSWPRRLAFMSLADDQLNSLVMGPEAALAGAFAVILRPSARPERRVPARRTVAAGLSANSHVLGRRPRVSDRRGPV